MHRQWGGKPKTAPSPWDFVALPEEDRATAIGNMHRIIGKGLGLEFGSGDILVDRQTNKHTQTDRHTHTCTSQYFATDRAGEVTKK